MRRFGRTVITLLTDPLARPRAACAIWSTFAGLSLAFAAWVATQPGRSRDFWEVRGWLDYWAFGRANPYDNFQVGIDYPPHALLLLTPLSWLPAHSATMWLAPITVALCVAAAWLSVTVTAELAGVRLARVQVWTLSCMVLSWGAIRTTIWLGQTMPVAFVLSLLSMRWALRRPALAGASLGLSTFKPNLAVGFVAALILLRRLRPFAAAIAVTGLCTIAFAATVRESPIDLTHAYLRKLAVMYGGVGYLRDWLGMRALLYEIGGSSVRVVVAYYVFLFASLALLAWLVARAKPTAAARAITFAAALLWALASFSHQRFNVVLLAPAFVLLLLPQVRLVANESARRWLSGLLAIGLTMDWPLDLRLVGERYHAWLPFDLAPYARNLGRLPALTLLAVVLWRLFKEGREDVPSHPSP